MLVTTKGRYGLRLMLNIAAAPTGVKVVLRRVADSEQISLKYLEQLAHALVEVGLLDSVRGHGGGYVLARPADQVRVGDVLRAVEGSTSPVACAGLEEGCPREDICPTIAFWAGLDKVVEEYVDGITLAQLADPGQGLAPDACQVMAPVDAPVDAPVEA